MSRGNEIVLTIDPKGVRDEGIIDDTSRPGMLVEIVPGAAMVNGRPHFRAVSRAAGTKGPVAVLLPDSLQGKLGVGGFQTGGSAAGDAYVAGTRCFVYWPVAGEELNLLLGDVAGTGDTVAIGDLFGVNNDGKIKRNAAYASTPFMSMEALAAPTADEMVWVKYLGNQA